MRSEAESGVAPDRLWAQRLRKGSMVAVAACVAVTVAACGSSSSASGGKSASSGGSGGSGKSLSAACGGKKCTIGVLNPDPVAQAYSASYDADMKKEAASLGVNLIIDESNYVASVQQSQMQELIAKKVNGIILFPAIYGTTASMLADAKVAKVPVDISNTVVNANESPLFHTFTGPNNLHLGELQASLVNKVLGGHGKIVYIMGQPGNETAILREQGLKQGLAKGITVLGIQPGDWLQAPSETATANLLTRFGSKVNMVVAADDTSAAGSAQAIKNAGLTGKVKLVGSGFYQVTPPLMKSKEETATLFQSPCWDAVNAVQKMVAVLKGQSVAKSYIMPLPAVTQANYKKFTPMGCLPGVSIG